jgi:acetylornithine deacetylase/succinyl-diaminopimelate desuccinylase-like protein
MLQFLNEKAPNTIRWELKKLSGSPASVVREGQPGLKEMSDALVSLWGKEPVFPREGGSIPIVGYMQKMLGIGSVLTGFGLPDDNLHAPNERLHLPTWYKGIEALIHFFNNF